MISASLTHRALAQGAGPHRIPLPGPRGKGGRLATGEGSPVHREAWTSVARWSGSCPNPPALDGPLLSSLGVPAPNSQGAGDGASHPAPHVLTGTHARTQGTLTHRLHDPHQPHARRFASCMSVLQLQNYIAVIASAHRGHPELPYEG